MGRPREFIIDGDQLLQAIYQGTIVRRQDLDRQITELQRQYDRDTFSFVQQLHQERMLADWLSYSAETLIGEALSDGHRRAVTRTVLELERDGYILGDGRRLAWVRLTDIGIERVEAQIEKKETGK